jgi:YD repeat-containing protein
MKSLKVILLAAMAITVIPVVYAGVNLKNGNFYLSYTDIVVPGGGKKLEITRTYNSKSTDTGWFGFGWGSIFETKLVLSADGSIVIYEHGSGAATRFTPKEPIDAIAASTKIVNVMKKKSALTEKAASDLIQKLANNSELRQDYAVNFGVQSTVPPGSVLTTNDRGPQELFVSKDGYRRIYLDGRVDYFNNEGKLLKIADKSGYFIGFNYKDGKLDSIKDSQAKQIFFSWYPGGLVKEIWSAGDKKAFYKFNDTDLVYSKDVGENVYEYVYDSSKNLEQVTYSDKTKLKISYDPKSFFVTQVIDRNAEDTKYQYGSDAKNPDDHYWTLVTKLGFDGKPVTNRYEYEIKSKIDGTRYTYRIISEINGVKTDTMYSENSLPIKIARGEHVTNFEYNLAGLLTKKSSTKGDFVNIEYLDKLNKIKKVVNNEGTTEFEYDEKGNLVKASNNLGKVVFLIYDSKGKISKMVDQESPDSSKKRILAFKYNALGKPVEIEMEKVGKINVAYDNYGEIKKVDSSAGHKMALQVTQAFQNLLTIVKPAGVNLNL